MSGRSEALTPVIGLALTLGVGSLPFPVWDNELADVRHMVGNECIYWTLVALTLAYVHGIERRPLSSIGVRRVGAADLAAGLAAAIATLVGLWLLYTTVLPMLHLSEDQQLTRLRSAPAWWLAASVVRAGVSEEVLFRGYPIERLLAWSGRRSVAYCVPWGLFTFAHVGPWGWAHLMVAGFGGFVLTGLYAWRRNLWANILAHCLVDGVAVLS